MELNEALHRIVLGHWRMLLVLTLLPVLVIAALQMRDKPGYAATARVQASNQTPSTTTEADAVLNRAQGIATSVSVVERALQQGHVTSRTPTQVMQETSVSRVGTSAVLNLTITDPDPRTAMAIDSALSTQLVTYLNGGPQTTSDASLVSQLTSQEQALLGQRSQVAAQLALARSTADSSRLSSQLSAIDQQLGAVQAELNGINNNSASVISQPAAAERAKSSLVTDVTLAALLGLVAGLLVASIVESVRPRVADAGAFGREIGAPLLGAVALNGDDEAEVVIPPETRVGARRAVAHHRVDTLVLTGPDPHGRLPFLADALERELNHGVSPAGKPRQPSLNGDGAGVHVGGAHTQRSAGGAMLSAPQLLEAPDFTDHPEPAATRPVRVRVLSELDDAPERSEWDESPREGLLVVVPDLVPHREVRRVRHLADATGWPLVGVLGVDRDRRRGRR
jgi:capsular polysaccharide biosynthesis protein